MATNRIDTLDPALIRPGRIDRKIEFPLPDIKTKRRIFHIHTSRMTLSDDVDVEEIVTTKDDLSGADVKVRLRVGEGRAPCSSPTRRPLSAAQRGRHRGCVVSHGHDGTGCRPFAPRLDCWPCASVA